MKKLIGVKKKPNGKTEQKGWFRRHMTGVILAVILIAGASLLAYPSVSNYWNQFHQTRAVMSYVDTVDHLDEEEYERVLQAAYDYNHMLAENGFDWKLTDVELAEYNEQLSIDSSGVMGYVNIPKINVMLPIYHGKDESVLQIAIGHLEATSLPVGAESYSHEERKVTDPTDGSHCAITGHRGLPSARLFTDLDQMVEGDQFSITVLNETMTYEVDQIRIVEPTDLSDLQVVPGEDYCTLITCTPYGINTHRLLVRGHRVENTFDDANIKPEAIKFQPGLIAPMVAAPILLILLIMLLIVTRKKKPARILTTNENNSIHTDNTINTDNDISESLEIEETQKQTKHRFWHRGKKN